MLTMKFAFQKQTGCSNQTETVDAPSVEILRA